MEFTRDLCRRLLGLEADVPAGEMMRVQEGRLDLSDRKQHGGSSQKRLASKESLDEEEEMQRRAERRREKKKRQKERRKQEQTERMEDGAGQEPEWDVSSAFVAEVANHIRPKDQKGRATGAEMKLRGEALTAKGIELFGKSCYSHALAMFTEAIHCDPNDHRFYGNRSFCYLCLEKHQPALADALRSIQLAPHWPKGYFRKGCALMALKRYPEAEQALEQVLELDPRCKEVPRQLLHCRLLQLEELCLDKEKSNTMADAEVSALRPPSLLGQSSCRSLWIGNVTVVVTKDDLWNLFQMFGEIESIRMLHERFCAFVNFENASMAAKALEMLNGVEIKGTKLVMRYPERWTQHIPPATKRQSHSVDETL